MQSIQVPDRTNLRSVRGIDALTGESNFDVAEYIWMRLLTELRRDEPTVALLCKTSVARRVLTLSADLGLNVADSFLWRIDLAAVLRHDRAGVGHPRPDSDSSVAHRTVHRIRRERTATTAGTDGLRRRGRIK